MSIKRRTLLGTSLALSTFPMTPLLPAAHAQTASPIRLGALNPITKAGSIFGPGMLRGIQYAVDDVNKLGGLLGGRPIQLFHEDSESSPDAGVRAAKKLIDINKVTTLLGTWSSGVTMAIAPIVQRDHVVNMNVSGTTELVEMSKDEWIWPCGGSNITYGQMMGTYAASQGYKKASFMAFNNPSGLTLGDEFKKVFEKAGGQCTIVVYNPNQPSYRAELTKALAFKPDVIALGSYLPDTTILLKEWYVMNVPMHWVGPIWAVSADLVKAVGPEAAEGIVSIGAVPNLDSPAYKAFQSRYESAMHQEVLANPFSAIAYDMVIVCALAIEAARSADPVLFRRHIRAVSSPPGKKVSDLKEAFASVRAGEKIDYEGVGGNMNFDAQGGASPYFASWIAKSGVLKFQKMIATN